MRAVLLCALLVAAVYATDWMEVDRALPQETVSLRFALKQRNLDVLEATLLDRADPYSPNYAKWWTTSQILDLVAPESSVADAVVNFLLQNGAMNVENRRDMIKCEMAVRNIETLLRTTMNVYEAGNSQIIRTRDGYTMPSEIAQYVDFISGLEEFPQVREDKTRPAKKIGEDIPAQGYVIPEHIQELYKIPSSFPNNEKTSIALVEFEDDTSYSKTDLEAFVQQMAIPDINVDHVVGPYNGSSPDAESTLDVQYGGAIAINGSVWFWTVAGWMYEFATDIQNTTDAPLVVSMSWGWPEPLQCQIDPEGCGTDSSFAYVDRVNVEFQKIGLSGITLVAASGDQGAPGDGNADCSNTTVPLWTIFPGASPWVLSVGATMLEGLFEEKVTADPPICSQYKCATSTKEGVCTYPDALITTGGGFSNISPRPSYQNTVVSAYLSSGVSLPDDSYYNKSNRGFPDVSALGHNYLISWNGGFQQVDGTSCSTPVLAGMITLLNSDRLNNGKDSLGFIVPLMYSAYASNAAIFNDINKGDNKCTEYCCSKIGYEATKGWDPVTGLGTPNFDQLLTYVKSLPN
jgi:tripeptidyl-peptidase-1